MRNCSEAGGGEAFSSGPRMRSMGTAVCGEDGTRGGVVAVLASGASQSISGIAVVKVVAAITATAAHAFKAKGCMRGGPHIPKCVCYRWVWRVCGKKGWVAVDLQ